jgi:uncharacterized protein YbjT (DUF2867 family)
MKKVLAAGSTGYLGQYVIKELKKQGYWVRALARNPQRLEQERAGEHPLVFRCSLKVGRLAPQWSLPVNDF